MENTSQFYPSVLIQTLFTVMFCILSTLYVFAEQGFWSLQALIVPSISNQTANGSFTEIPRLSDHEYEAILAISELLSFLAVYFSGVLLDSIGMPACAFIVTVLLFVGSFIRAMAWTITKYHLLTVVGVGVGQSIVTCCSKASMNIRHYTDIRYFPSNIRPFIISVHLVFVRCGSILAFFATPKLGQWYGVMKSLWLLAGSTVPSLLCGIVIFAMSKLSSDLKVFESINRQHNLERNRISFCGDLKAIDVVQTYKHEFWLTLICASIARACFEGTFENAMKILNVYFDASISNASHIICVSFALEMFSTLLTGIAMRKCNFKGFVSLLGVTTLFVSQTLLAFLPHGSPVFIISLAISNGISLTGLTPLIGDYVPNDYLGFAVALVVIMGSVFGTLATFMFSIIFRYAVLLTDHEKWKVALIILSIYSFTSFSSVIRLFYRIIRVKLSSQVSACTEENEDDQLMAKPKD